MTAISANKILKYISEVYYHRKIKEYISRIVSVTEEIEKYQKQVIGEKIGRQGYERVCKEFNTQKNTEKLVDIFKYYS